MVLEPARTRPTSNDWTGDYRQARLRGLTPLDEIGAGDRIFVSSACAEPVTVIADLTRRAESGRLRDVTSYMILGGSTGSLLGAARQGHRVLAMAASTKQASDFFPWTMYQTADLMRSGELCFDVAIVQTTMPDQHGYMSLGVSADFARQAVAQARVVIAEANPRMPYTGGGNHVHTSQLDGIVEVDYPLAQESLPPSSAATRAIAELVLGHVPDGATIEVGVGRVMADVLAAMAAKNDIGLHTGLFVDGMVDLIENGNITNSRVGTAGQVSVTTQARGTQRLYDFLDRNPAVQFRPAWHTHNPAVLGRLPDFRAINSALQVDLMGQVNAETRNGLRVSTTGGLGDFARAAVYTPGARSVIALTAADSGSTPSRIVPRLGAGSVTLTADLADVVVTEYGAAVVRGKPPRERAEALIAVADPRQRDRLASALQGRF